MLLLASTQGHEPQATGRILCAQLAPMFAQHLKFPQMLVDFGTDGDGLPMLPEKVCECLVVCTRGCLTEASVRTPLLSFAGTETALFPVIADPNFTIPTKKVLLASASLASVTSGSDAAAAEALAKLILWMFKTIAVTVDPLGSAALLKAQATRIAKGIQDAKQRNFRKADGNSLRMTKAATDKGSIAQAPPTHCSGPMGIGPHEQQDLETDPCENEAVLILPSSGTMFSRIVGAVATDTAQQVARPGAGPAGEAGSDSMLELRLADAMAKLAASEAAKTSIEVKLDAS